jgi:N-acetylglucosamine-6-phosphate deacetylase
MNNKQINKIVLVTDALTPTALQSGALFANGDEVCMKDNVFYTKDTEIMAGSSLTMQQGIKNLVSWGISIEHTRYFWL